MTAPDKFSAVTQQQLDFFQQFTSRAFENAERIVALNMATTRATMDFGRQLFEMANKPAAKPAATPTPPPAPAPAPADHIVTAAPVIVSAPVPEPVPEPAPVASTVQPSEHPLGEADTAPAPVSIAKAKPIAKAASKLASTPVDVPHPAASPIPPEGPVDIPAITPAPAKRSNGGASKGSRKR